MPTPPPPPQLSSFASAPQILNFAGELRIVPEIIRPWFEELHAKLSLFTKAVEDVDQVNCIDWVPEDFRGGLCNLESNLLLRSLLNPLVDACATLKSVPTLSADYRHEAAAFSDGVLDLYVSQKTVTQVFLSPHRPRDAAQCGGAVVRKALWRNGSERSLSVRIAVGVGRCRKGERGWVTGQGARILQSGFREPFGVRSFLRMLGP